MKLISLNTWCGIKFEQLMEFIKRESQDTDIFCFQEVRNGEYYDHIKEEGERENLFQEMEAALPDFQGYYSAMVLGVGMAVFVRKDFVIEKVEAAEILSASDMEHIRMADGSLYYPRVIQSLYFKNKELVVYNFHGIPGISKIDTPERDLQTKRLLEHMSKDKKPHIIVGDFNLDLNTAAISSLGKEMRNLIKESGAKTTRNHNYKAYQTIPYADFAFVSPGVEVENFSVLGDEVSDHLPLSLIFDC